MTTNETLAPPTTGDQEFRRIISAVFPDGVTPDQYWPLVTALRQEMSFRSVARHIPLVFGKSWPEAYNDATKVDSQPMCDPADAERVRALLDAQGFVEWLDTPA